MASDLLDMSYELRDSPVPGLFELVFHGELTLEGSRTALVECLPTLQQQPGRPLLVDTRDAKVTLSPVEVYDFANALAEAGFSHRLAILNHPSRDFNPGLFLEQLSPPRKLVVKQFDDYQAAVSWLTTVAPVEDRRA